jgi:hypothetical protein
MRVITACFLACIALSLPARAENISLDCQISPAKGGPVLAVHVDVTPDGVAETEPGAAIFTTNKEENSSGMITKEYFSITPIQIKYGKTWVVVSGKGEPAEIETVIDRQNGSYLSTKQLQPFWRGKCEKGAPIEKKF